jgi:hypothetical protein
LPERFTFFPIQELLEKVFACPQFARPQSEEVDKWLRVLALYFFGVAAAGFKARKFAPEHEVRLTVANHRELSLAGTALPTEQSENKVEYLEVNLRHLETGNIPLKEIVIGPKADPTEAIRIVRSAIESSGYIDVGACQIRQIQMQAKSH